MDNSHKQNMNYFGHKLPIFEQAAWAVDNRAIINHDMPKEHANIRVIEKPDLTSGSQSEWFNMLSDIAMHEQSIEDIYTHLEYSPSMAIPEKEGAIETNLGYLSDILLPSTSVPEKEGAIETNLGYLSDILLPSTSVPEKGAIETNLGYLSDILLPSTSVPEKEGAIETNLGYLSDIFLPSTLVPEKEGAIETNLGYLSDIFLPSTLVPDDQLLLGTRSTPIIIPDSPDRDNSPAQGERRQSYHKRKRAREPESELELIFSNPLNNMKKAKKMHDSRRNESQLPSIQNDTESKNFVAGWDGVQYVNGRMLIPLGRDLVLEELLSTTTVQENADHVSRELGPASLPDSHEDNYFTSLPDDYSLQYATRCTIPSSLKPQTGLRHKGFIEISLGE